jgi:hypothetical protein
MDVEYGYSLLFYSVLARRPVIPSAASPEKHSDFYTAYRTFTLGNWHIYPTGHNTHVTDYHAMTSPVLLMIHRSQPSVMATFKRLSPAGMA